MKWLFLLLMFVACNPEKELFAVEKPFILIEIKRVYRSGDYIWSMKWATSDSLKITIFKRAEPDEKVGKTIYWPVILSNWEK